MSEESKEKNKKVILALETALGGSVSIIRGDREVDSALFSGGASKAEELIAAVDSLLKRNGVQKKDIARIAISDGPGSHTGLRVGTALAKGLRSALGVEYVRVPVLDAMAMLSKGPLEVLAAVSVGRRTAVWQIFFVAENGTAQPEGGPASCGYGEFLRLSRKFAGERKGRTVVTPELAAELRNLDENYPEGTPDTEVLDGGLAAVIGRRAAA